MTRNHLPSMKRRHSTLSAPLETPIARFNNHTGLTIRQAFEGVQIFGGSGSGKTSGSGRALACGFLKMNFGGLVLCVKPGEADTWREYARETNREPSFLFIDGSEGQGFNFLDYELNAQKGNQVNNAVEVFMHVMKHATGSEQQSHENPFWDNSVRDLLRYCLTALQIAYGSATLAEVFGMAVTAHVNEQQKHDPQWQQSSFCNQTLVQAMKHGDPRDLSALAMYFDDVWGSMDSKLRSNIVATLSSLCGSFMLGRLRDLFCSKTSFVPEMTHNGTVIVLDMPTKTWHQDGIIAQHIIKYAWQRATERRDKNTGRNVFLWVDEAQDLISSYDDEFQSTARESRAATVYMTQNINKYISAIGGNNAYSVVRGLLGNLKTKIFHSNDDTDTNNYAVELIGKSLQWRATQGISGNEGISTGTNDSVATGTTESEGFGRNDGVSYGENESESMGTSDSFSVGKSKGRSAGTTIGTSSTGSLFNNNQSDTSSFSTNNGSTTGTSKTETTGNSHTVSNGTSTTQTKGTNQTRSMGTSNTTTRGSNETRSRGGGWNLGRNQQKDVIIDPEYFRNQLATGGPTNQFTVEGIVIQSGKGVAPYTLVKFRQC